MSIQIQSLDLSYFVKHLETRNYFSFVRYGDGEFASILGRQGVNCDGHQYFEKMGQELQRTLKEPHKGNYLYALGPKAARVMRNEVTPWLGDYAKRLIWYDTEVLLHASLQGALAPLIEALCREHQVVLVGPAHLYSIVTQQNYRHVLTPTINAWQFKKQIRHTLKFIIAQCAPTVVLFSAGMVSKILIWELFAEYGNKMMLWDTGSLFDMYCGVDSRSYARRMPPERKQELLHLNFERGRITDGIAV